ncbi:apolipoprotein F-like [Erinaceus europaeus]|uniref:Apolipoprotein F-like n=1 Tax=Erinaceus europaeus TaxID=9365 RepID=A0A1S3ADV5_ERIEU|nr:apolipoprotein F-like [Erinaceus europaeus]
MILAVLLLGCVLLSPVKTLPINVQKGDLDFNPSFREARQPPDMLSNQIPVPGPQTCQNLLQSVPSLAPLPEFLSSLALELALEKIGCTTEAQMLQEQLIRMGGKDTTEALLRESKKHNEEEIDATKGILKDLGVFTGEVKRVQRSVALTEACRSEDDWVRYETAMMMAEFADKLPVTELVTKLKNSAIDVTQKCTDESWQHLKEAGQQLLESPEIQYFSMPLEDQIYFIKRTTTIFIRVIVDLIHKHVQIFMG